MRLSAGSNPRASWSKQHSDELLKASAAAAYPPIAPSGKLLAFGCPEAAVPREYLGPRRGLFAARDDGAAQARLQQALQAHLREDVPDDAAAMARIDTYDMAGVSALGAVGGMKQACLIWKAPVRRRALRHLDCTRSGLGDAAVGTLARMVAQAPSAPAPLRLDTLTLDDNDVWAVGVGKLLTAFASNAHASVQQLHANNTHAGGLAAHAGVKSPTGSKEAGEEGGDDAAAVPAAAAAPAAAVAASSGGAAAAPSGSLSPRSQSVALASHATSVAVSAASACFTPWVAFLSAPHCALTTLSLCQVGLSDVAVAYLAEGLRANHTLHTLRLDENLLTDSGIKVLAAALGGRYAEEMETAAAAATAAALAAAAAADAAALAEEGGKTTARPSSRGGGNALRTPGSSAIQAPGSAGPTPSHASLSSGGSSKKKSTHGGDEVSGGPSPQPVAFKPAHTKRLSFSVGTLGGTMGSPIFAQSKPGSAEHKEESKEEAEPDPALVLLQPLDIVLPMPSFAGSAHAARTNASLTSLSVRANRLSAVGLAALESAVRVQQSLRVVDARDQVGVRSFEASEHGAAEQVLQHRCADNRARALRAVQQAVLLGLHPRAGGHSSLRTLLSTAREYASASSEATQAVAARAGKPALRVRPPTASTARGDNPTAVLLAATLSQVWDFLGEP